MIEWSVDAKRDLRRLSAFLAAKDPDAVDAAIEAIVAAIDRISHFPLSAPATDMGSNLRKLSIGGSYVALYTVFPNRINVVRVYHATENWRLI